MKLWDKITPRKGERMGLKAGANAKLGSLPDDGWEKEDYVNALRASQELAKLTLNTMPSYNAQAAQSAGHGFGMSGMQNAASAHAAMASQQQYPQAVNQYGASISTNNWGHIATMTALDIAGIEIKGLEVIVSFRTGDEFGDPRSYHQKVAMPIKVFRQMIKMFTVESMKDKGEEDEG